MAKSRKQNKQHSRTKLGQKTGGMLDKKTNEDFNNEYPDHDESGLIEGGLLPDGKPINTKAKQTSINKKTE